MPSVTPSTPDQSSFFGTSPTGRILGAASRDRRGSQADDLVTAQGLEKGLEAAAHQAAQDRTVDLHLADPRRPLDLLGRRDADETDFHSLCR